METKKAEAIEKAKKILGNADPRVAMMAIIRSENEMKEAIAVSKQIKGFDKEVLYAAYSELNSAGSVAYCGEGPSPGWGPGGCRACIARMEVFDFDKYINVAKYRGAIKAKEMNAKLGEM